MGRDSKDSCAPQQDIKPLEGLRELKPEDPWSPQDRPCVVIPIGHERNGVVLDPFLQGLLEPVLMEEYIQASGKLWPQKPG